MNGSDTSIHIHPITIPGSNDLSISNAPISSNSWVSIVGDFQTQNDLYVSGIAHIANEYVTNLTAVNLSALNANIYNLTGVNNYFTNENVTHSHITNLTATNLSGLNVQTYNLTGVNNYFTNVTISNCLSTNCISPYTTNATISAHGNIDMLGYSISGIGDASLSFQSGAKISSPLSGLQLSTGSSPRVNIDKDGNVGIGTATPSNQLSLGGYGAIGMVTGNTKGFITHQYGSDTGKDYLSLASNFTRTNGLTGSINTNGMYASEIRLENQTAYAGGESQVVIGTTNVSDTIPTDQVFIKGNGNVGIGTSTPAHNLQVGDGTGSKTVSILGGLSAVNPTYGGRLIVGNTSYFGQLGNINQIVGGDTGTNDIYLQSTYSDLRIGTESAKDIEFVTNGWSNTRMIITSGGNIGMGTLVPASQLDIVGATSDTLRIGNVNQFYKIGRNTGDGLLDIEGSQAGYTGYNFKDAGGTSRLYIKSNGNVGIGTDTPHYKLDVNGTSNFTDTMYFPKDTWLISNTDGQNRIYFTGNGSTRIQGAGTGVQHIFSAVDGTTIISTVSSSNGNNVGIGTSAPNEKLTVVGNISASNTIIASVADFTNLSANNIYPHTAGASISAHGNIDMLGYSISGIGNSSLSFQSGAKITSQNNGGLLLKPNTSWNPADYPYIHILENNDGFTGYGDITISCASGVEAYAVLTNGSNVSGHQSAFGAYGDGTASIFGNPVNIYGNVDMTGHSISTQNIEIGGNITFTGMTTIDSNLTTLTASNLFATLTINGSAFAMPLYKYN